MTNKILLLIASCFFISVASKAQCNCSPLGEGWSPFTLHMPLPVGNIKCGQQINLCISNSDTLFLRGKFKCDNNCTISYRSVLKFNGVVMEKKTHTANEVSFGRRFRSPGNYLLTIEPFCKNKICTPCSFPIAVAACL